MRETLFSPFTSRRARAGRRALGLFAVALALAAVAACGGNGDGARARTSQERTPVVEVNGTAEITTPLAAIQEASIALKGAPDWMTFYRGFIWVKRADGIVTRIDPRTNRPSGEVRADTKRDPFCEGLGSGGGAVWSCSGSDVVRIDPARLEVVASIPVRKVFNQGRLVFAGGRLWVISGEGDRLVGVDVSTNRVGPTIKLPVACSDLGPGPDTVWVLCPNTGAVLAVDPVSASVAGRLDLPNPSAAFETEDGLWVVYEEGLARIDVKSLKQVARFADLSSGAGGGDVVVAGQDVWVRTEFGFLHRIDATSNTVAVQAQPEDGLGGGSVLVAAGSVWTTAFDHNLLFRLRPEG